MCEDISQLDMQSFSSKMNSTRSKNLNFEQFIGIVSGCTDSTEGTFVPEQYCPGTMKHDIFGQNRHDPKYIQYYCTV